MSNNFTKILAIFMSLLLLTLSFFSLKVYYAIQELGNYSGQNFTHDLLNSFCYAVGPICIGIIGFRKSILKGKIFE